MAKISINLLPPEFITQELKKTRFYKIQFIGIAIILLVTFLTSLIIALRILQSRNIAIVQAELDQAEQKVLSFQDTQASLFLLKDRLTVINRYLGEPSKQALLYKLTDKLMPPAVLVNSVSIDRNGNISLSLLVPDSESLDVLLNNLTSKENNEGKLGQVSIEGLSRGRSELYRISFKIEAK